MPSPGCFCGGAWGAPSSGAANYTKRTAAATPSWYPSGTSAVCCEYDPINGIIYFGDAAASASPSLLHSAPVGGGAATTLIDSSLLTGFSNITVGGNTYDYRYVYWWKDFSYQTNTAVGVARYGIVGSPSSTQYFAFSATVGSAAVTLYPNRMPHPNYASISHDGTVWTCSTDESNGQYAAFKAGSVFADGTALGLPSGLAFSFYPYQKLSTRIVGIASNIFGTVYMLDSASTAVDISTYIPAGDERTAFSASASLLFSGGGGQQPKWSLQQNRLVGNTFTLAAGGTRLARFGIVGGQWRAAWPNVAMDAAGMHHPVVIRG